MKGAGQRPPVEHGILCGEQRTHMVAQRIGFMADAVVALQHGYVADCIRHVGKDGVVVALDRLLAVVGLVHDQPPDRDVESAEQHQHHRHPEIERERRRHQQHEGHDGRQMLTHEFEPERKQRLDRAQQRMQRVGSAAFLMPGKRHGNDALEGFAKYARPPCMGDTIRATGHEDEGDNVESAEAGPQRQRGKHFALLGYRVYDTPEQDRLGDGDHGKHDIGAADESDTLLVGAKISECSPVNFEQ